jgi:cobalamin biosynthesis protein CobW
MRVPAIVLTGFLGSGKTTLLNRLLAERPAELGRIAIIVNELGAVGVDGDLLPRGMARQVELPGGCICCVLNEQLDRTVLELLDGTPDLAMLIIETTGVAEPLPICWTFEVEPLVTRVRAAAVVTVVDALEHPRNRRLVPAVDLQVEYADVLIASKRDLLPEGRIPEALERSLRELNPHAPLVAGPAALWQVLLDPPMGPGRPRPGEAPHAHAEGGPPLQSLAVELPDTLDFEELSEQLEALPASYVRIKGIARVVDRTTGSAEPHTVAFHRVGARVSSEPLATDAAPRMVALGTGLDRAALAACVAAAVLPSGIDGPGPGGGRRS